MAGRRLLRELFRSSCRGLGKEELQLAQIEMPKGRLSFTRIFAPGSESVCRGLTLRVNIRRNRSREKSTVNVIHIAP